MRYTRLCIHLLLDHTGSKPSTYPNTRIRYSYSGPVLVPTPILLARFFLIAQKKEKTDHVMLLGESSDDDDHGIPVWQFD